MSSFTAKRVQRKRREFLHKRLQDSQERAIFERKQAVKDALAKGKSGPRGSGAASATDPAASLDLDDEYAQAGIEDPKILITTSRSPSSKLAQFAREMRLVFPNSHRVNRGNYIMKEMADVCRSNAFTDLIVLHETRGRPDAMVLSHFPHGPTILFTLSAVALRHDSADYRESTVSQQYPHLIFENFTSKLGERVKSCLRYLFPVPREDSKRVMTFANDSDSIAFRHHVFVQTSHKEVQLAEVGPRFDMRPYEIRQGTLEMTTADVEWVLRRAFSSLLLSHAYETSLQHTCERRVNEMLCERCIRCKSCKFITAMYTMHDRISWSVVFPFSRSHAPPSNSCHLGHLEEARHDLVPGFDPLSPNDGCIPSAADPQHLPLSEPAAFQSELGDPQLVCSVASSGLAGRT